MIRPSRSAALAGLCCILLGAPGCFDRHNPVTPRDPDTTLQTVWPNEDGRSWSYQVVDRTLAEDGGSTTYPSPEAVPPAPSMTQVAALLNTLPFGTVVHSDTASFGLRFHGWITTQSGVIRQNLVETLIPLPAQGAARTPAGGQAAFLAQLYRARPDLRPILRARFSSVALTTDTMHTYASIFLHGYAWEKTTAWIGTYGDVDTLLAWKFLASRISPGSEFVHQLVPSLATDVWLHGRILGRQTVRTHAGTFERAVVCAYLIDFGLSEKVDDAGNPLGYARNYSYGSVAYVDGVGPVACYERPLVWAGGPSFGGRDVTLLLTGYAPDLPMANRR